MRASLGLLVGLSLIGKAADAADTAAAVPTATSSDNESKLQEVIVTAEKREERLQDVPMAVSVISADEMLQNHEIYLRDYVATVPGVSVQEGGQNGFAQIVIRGLSDDTNPTVGVTIDDVPVGLTNTAASFGNTAFVPQLDPADLERVEVLKGPQGTLYGASSIGGVLKYVTASPDLTSTFGRVEVDGSTIPDGGGTGYGVRGGANISIVAGTFGVRVSAFHREDPGFIDDPTHQLNNLNAAYATGGRLDSLWQITPDLSVRVTGLIDRTEYVQTLVDTAYSTGTLYYSPISGDLTHDKLPGAGWNELEHQLYDAIVKFHTHLFDVTSITALGRANWDATSDWTPNFGFLVPVVFASANPALAASCPCGAVDPSILDTRKWTQELRLASPSGKTLEWLVGAFYTAEIMPTGKFSLQAADLQTGIPLPGGNIITGSFGEHFHEYAGFADLTYHVNDQFDVQVGARESHNWQYYINYATTGLFSGPALGSGSEDNSFTYLFTPKFRFSDSLMAYARIASGYLPGGPNNVLPGVALTPLTYGPTKSVNYELGIKGSFFEKRATVEADIFDVQWTDVQLTGSNALANYIFNGGAARSQGAEMQLHLLPYEGLTISASAAYVDAILTESAAAGSTNPIMAGDWLPYGSRWSGSLSAEQQFKISSSATAFLGATWAYVGKRYSDYSSVNPDGGQNLWPGYNYTNARIGIQWDDYTFTAFVNNATNSRGILSAVPQTPALVLTAVTTPRTVGLSVKREFR